MKQATQITLSAHHHQNQAFSLTLRSRLDFPSTAHDLDSVKDET